MYKLTRGLNRKEKEAKDRANALLAFRRHFIFDACMRTLPETDFRGKIEPPVEKGVLKIERYAQRLTQGYSADGGSYLWAPAEIDSPCSPLAPGMPSGPTSPFCPFCPIIP